MDIEQTYGETEDDVDVPLTAEGRSPAVHACLQARGLKWVAAFGVAGACVVGLLLCFYSVGRSQATPSDLQDVIAKVESPELEIGGKAYTLGLRFHVCGGKHDQVSCEYKNGARPWARYVNHTNLEFNPSRRRGTWRCDYWLPQRDGAYQQRIVINGVEYPFTETEALSTGVQDCRYASRVKCKDTDGFDCSPYTSASKCDSADERAKENCCECGGGKPEAGSSFESAPLAVPVVGSERRRWQTLTSSKYSAMTADKELYKAHSPSAGPVTDPLPKCGGFCKTDVDCISKTCYKREALEVVPGCSGEGRSGWNYCTDDSNAALMIGNSYTFCMFRTISSVVSLSSSPFTVRKLAKMGVNLTWHKDNVESKSTVLDYNLLTDHKWKYIIIQEAGHMPTRCCSFNPITAGPQGIFEQSLQSVRWWGDKIKELGAQPVIFQPWARRGGYATLKSKLIDMDFLQMSKASLEGVETYAAALSEAGHTPLVAPVGRAFDLVYMHVQAAGMDPEREGSLYAKLYNEDSTHEAPHGQYLATCVLYGTMTGKSVLELPLPEKCSRFSSPDVVAEACDISEEEGATLRQIAEKAVTAYNTGKEGCSRRRAAGYCSTRRRAGTTCRRRRAAGSCSTRRRAGTTCRRRRSAGSCSTRRRSR